MRSSGGTERSLSVRKSRSLVSGCTYAWPSDSAVGACPDPTPRTNRPGVVPFEPVLARRERLAPAAPDVDDAGADHEPAGGGQDRLDQVQVVRWTAADPDRAETEALQFLGRRCDQIGILRPQPAAHPDSVAPELVHDVDRTFADELPPERNTAVYLMISTYVVPLDEVDRLRDAHLAFLDGLRGAGPGGLGRPAGPAQGWRGHPRRGVRGRGARRDGRRPVRDRRRPPNTRRPGFTPSRGVLKKD